MRDACTNRNLTIIEDKVTCSRCGGEPHPDSDPPLVADERSKAQAEVVCACFGMAAFVALFALLAAFVKGAVGL